MKKILVILFATIILSPGTDAQTNRHLTPALLQELEKSCVPDARLKAAQHTLAQVDGNKISQDWEKIIGVDEHFSLRLKDQKITDQKGTGRCWMFSGLNVVRPMAAAKLGAPDIELSQN